jgi:endonuclease/exonuclease/phosphatase (EEP) superfamily protein YafD
MAQIMGPEAAEGIRVAYGYTNAQPNDATSVNMAPVLERLPVRLTKLEDWVRGHKDAFAPKK